MQTLSGNKLIRELERVIEKEKQKEKIASDKNISFTLPELSLNSDSAQVQTLLAECQRFVMVRISGNGPGWK